MKMKPEISVLMPVKDTSPDLLKKSIDSILNQDIDNIEFVIIDDGSQSKETLEVLESVKKSDHRVCVFKNKSTGIVSALNFGLSKCRASIVARMDSDDESLVNRLSSQFEFLKKNSGVSIVGTGISIRGWSKKEGFRDSAVENIYFPVEPSLIRESYKSVRDFFCLAHPTVMFRKKDIIEVGGYMEGFNRAEDLYLWLRVLSAGYSIANLDKIYLNYFQGSSNISSINRAERYFNTSLLVNAYFFGKVDSLRKTSPYEEFTDEEKLKILCNFISLLVGINDEERSLVLTNTFKKYSDLLKRKNLVKATLFLEDPNVYKCELPIEYIRYVQSLF